MLNLTFLETLYRQWLNGLDTSKIKLSKRFKLRAEYTKKMPI